MSDTTIIDQINAFCLCSKGVLRAIDQAVYLRIMYWWNYNRRPDWVSVANSTIMAELCIRNKHTVIESRRRLVQAGFLEAIDPGHHASIKYHLVHLDPPQEMEPKGAKDAPLTKAEGTKDAPSTKTKGAKIAPKGCEKYTQVVRKSHPYQSRDTEVNNNNSVLTLFAGESEQRITPIVRDTLAELVEKVGEGMVMEAIKDAARKGNGKCNVAYIRGTIRNWLQSGKDKPWVKSWDNHHNLQQVSQAEYEADVEVLGDILDHLYPSLD